MRHILEYNYIMLARRKYMDFILSIIQKCLVFEKEPQKIGLCQLKEPTRIETKKEVSIKNKNVKLSDLMRRAS